MTRHSPDGYALFEAIYDDGSLSTGRKLRLSDLGEGGDAAALALLQAQELQIAEMMHRPGRTIRSVRRA